MHRTAIVGLGLLPSVLSATRLVVIYERQDVNVALQMSVDPDDAALVAVDAGFDGHAAVAHPLRVTPAPDWRQTGSIIPEWGTPGRIPGDELPGPVEQLLVLWRRPHRADLHETLEELEAGGYRMRWMAR